MTELTASQQVDEDFLADFLARWEEAWSSGDPTRVADLLTEDVIFQSPDIPSSLHGREEALGYLNMLFRAFPDQRLEVLDFYLTADGTRAADRAHWGGTMTGPFEPPGYEPTGRWVEMTAFGGFRFRDDRVAWFQAVFDMLDIGRQIGAVPVVGSFTDRMGLRMQRRLARKARKARRG